MAVQYVPVPRALMHGYAIGALFLTFFGALWALLTLSALTVQQRVVLVVMVVIVAGMLAYAAIKLLRAGQQLPRSLAPRGARPRNNDIQMVRAGRRE